MATHDEAIDRLYQLPLGEFTAARNALATQAGARGPEIKRLEKPNLAAWAVNQLYWRARTTYDEVVAAADALRAEQRKQLSGKSANVMIVEAKQRGVLQKAKHAIRQFLEGAGAAPDPVMNAVAETLDALPGPEAPGRLTKPFRRVGFGVLAGVPMVTPPRKPKEEEPSKKESKADERAHAMANERLRFAEAAEREAEAALERAGRALERGDAIVDRITRELAEAAEAARDLRQKAAAADAALKRAITQREQRARALAALAGKR
ncbi:MAG: hypothetical protein ABI665_07180 [Vicinamibacterales bacterium]